MLIQSISICLRVLINHVFYKFYLWLRVGAGWLAGWEPGHERFLNRKQARGRLSELAYISQAKAETKGRETKGSSRYLVSL